MAVLVVIDVVAAVLVIAGFHIGFRQTLLRSMWARLREPHSDAPSGFVGAASDPEGVASVLRIAGVMIMAFSFTAATFANLIVYYGASGAP